MSSMEFLSGTNNQWEQHEVLKGKMKVQMLFLCEVELREGNTSV